MRLLNRIKYRLLRMLLNDICCESDCGNCSMRTRLEVLDYVGMGCEERDIFYQARKVWGIDNAD